MTLMLDLSLNSQQIWSRVLAKLKFRHGEATFNSWLRQLSFTGTNSGVAMLSAPTRFIREWVATHYRKEILQYLQEEGLDAHTLEWDISNQPTTQVTQHHESALLAKLPEAVPKEEPFVMADVASPLDPRFTFSHFISDTSNELALAAAKAVAESSALIPGSNPLYFHGPVGLGKTHLMHAIAQHIRGSQPQRKVLYLSAEKFMYLFVRALRQKEIMAFKEQFRSVDVLMIDDLQFICGKESTQEEFFHTFNALMDSQRQLVLAADRAPSALEGLEDRVRSRLGWGLVADIGTTSFALRKNILHSKASQLGVELPESLADFLANKITSNIRELEGALNKLAAHARFMRREMTLETAQDILSDLLTAHAQVITVEDIKKAVCNHCHVRPQDMLSAQRSRHVARPRQLAMYLAKKLTTHSLPDIGRKFGGRDHTTVMHAVKRIESLAETDTSIASDIQQLTKILQS